MLEQRFNGSDYDQERDGARLSGQLARIFEVVKDGKWRSLRQIADEAKAPEASVSAQLRHLRKPRFGNYTVEKQYHNNGLFFYRLNMEDKL